MKGCDDAGPPRSTGRTVIPRRRTRRACSLGVTAGSTFTQMCFSACFFAAYLVASVACSPFDELGPCSAIFSWYSCFILSPAAVILPMMMCGGAVAECAARVCRV